MIKDNCKSRIAVIESKWNSSSNVSIKSFFDLISDINFHNPHHFHYEQASSEPAMKEAIPRVARDKRIKFIYIATHGNAKSLSLHNGQKITRLEIRNQLKAIKEQPGSTLDGLYLGSCLVGSGKFAEFLYEENIAPAWVAGYDQEISWLESSALDMLFFNTLIAKNPENISALAKIGAVANSLKSAVPGLIKDLGFGVYVRKPGAKGGAKDLLADVKV